MSLTGIRLEDITEKELQSLVDNQVRENKVLEYKEALPGNANDDKKEFLADVSAFANASGGDLLFGIREKDGVASEVCGVDAPNLDQEKQRLENILRHGLEPRIPGIAIQEIPLSTSKIVLLLRIPRSWAMPHRITFKARPQFYSRNSAGKSPLDTTGIRNAFVVSGTRIERIRNFRVERLSKIVAGETPAPLMQPSEVVLHIVPIGAFDPSNTIDLALVEKYGIQPISGKHQPCRYNFDGIVSSMPYGKDCSYVQIFRDGAVEAVNTIMLHGDRDKEGHYLYGEDEHVLVEAIIGYLKLQHQLAVEPPLFIMLSYLGVSGRKMPYGKPGDIMMGSDPIDRDTLLIPEVMIQNFDSDVPETMRPIFDTIWNATGFPRSLNYDETGKWIEKSR